MNIPSLWYRTATRHDDLLPIRRADRQGFLTRMSHNAVWWWRDFRGGTRTCVPDAIGRRD